MLKKKKKIIATPKPKISKESEPEKEVAINAPGLLDEEGKGQLEGVVKE